MKLRKKYGDQNARSTSARVISFEGAALIAAFLVLFALFIRSIRDPKPVDDRVDKSKIIEFIDSAKLNAFQMDRTEIQQKVEEGQLYSVDGQQIAIISSINPISLLISCDNGESWSEKTSMIHLGENLDCSYCSIFIDLNTDGVGCLVIGYGVNLGTQKSRCFLTENSGADWFEIPSVSDEHGFVITGAGYSSQGILSVAFRYYLDNGPDIWYTSDNGASWHQSLIAQYPIDGEFRFTPRNMSFDGPQGECDVEVYDVDKGEASAAHLYSQDAGKEWRWEK